ncbi:MAG: CalY family protein [Clostridium sp.]|nr:CalY family protein [Clostridium sp.]
MKIKKSYLILIISVLILLIGVSFAYFSLEITGNDTAKYNTITTGDLKLTFTDTNALTLDNALPGDSATKTISVKNTGTIDTSYNIVWQELTNTITNDELVIEATCKRLNTSNTEEGTCESISQKVVSSNKLKLNIPIEAGITHEYTLKLTFIDTGSTQNYNKNKSFNGKIGLEEYKNNFNNDSWATIVANVKANNISKYNVGDTKEVDMGTYGTHTLRIANTSTPSECSTAGFSQTACGFVLEFADIITTHKMNDTATNVGGWPATSMRTFVNNDIYNAIPSELRNLIIDTATVSGHGSEDTENFTSTDKLYLLAPGEVWSDWKTISDAQYDTTKNLTRTLDYYTAQGVTTSNYSGAIKKNGTNAYIWCLRTPHSITYNSFFVVNYTGGWTLYSAHDTNGVSPAFRIG